MAAQENWGVPNMPVERLISALGAMWYATASAAQRLVPSPGQALSRAALLLVLEVSCMHGAVLVLAALTLVVLLGVGVASATELFAVRVRAGRVEFLRGRAPSALVADFRDVLRGAEDAKIRVVLDGGRPALRVRGAISADRAQRLRNVLGRFTTAQLRTAPRCRYRHGG